MAFIGSSTTPANFGELQEGIQVTGDDITDGDSNVIFDQTNNHVPLDILEENSLTVTPGVGLRDPDGSGGVGLGNSVTLNINVTDFTGGFISGDGANNIQVNLGNGLKPDPNNSDQIAFDESLIYKFASNITFEGGVTFDESDLDMGTNIIKNLPSPSDAADAARKGYVDGVAQGLNIKDSVSAATAGNNIDLGGISVTSIDGVPLSSGDRVLLKDQSNPSENGIYVVDSTSDTSTWGRASDFDKDSEIRSGSFAFVSDGNTNGSSSFTVITEDPISLGDEIIFDQFASAGEIVPKNGIAKNGRQLSIVPEDVITGSDGLNVDANGNIKIFSDSSLLIDGSGKLSIDTSNTLTFSSVQNFDAGLDVNADVTDGTNVVYDSSAGEIPDDILGTIKNATLANTEITVNANNGLSGGGTAAIGDTSNDGIGIEIKPGDFIDADQLSIDGNGNISIDDVFISNSGDRITGPFTFGDFFDLEPITVPSSPAAGDMRVFIDSNDNNLKAKTDDGSTVTLIST